MSEDLLLVFYRNKATGAKDGLILGPSDENSYNVLDKMQNGEIVRCEVSRPRNERHHRLAFKLMKEVYKNQNLYSTFETMYDAFKIATGHFDMFIMPSGEKVIRTRSLAWHMMDQTEFQQWWEKLLEFLTQKVIPSLNRKDLEQHVYEMLGGPTPRDTEKK